MFIDLVRLGYMVRGHKLWFSKTLQVNLLVNMVVRKYEGSSTSPFRSFHTLSQLFAVNQAARSEERGQVVHNWNTLMNLLDE